MGWFENQIEERREADRQRLEDSFVRISEVVLGEKTAERISNERIVTKHVIDEILKYYNCKPVAVPDNVTDTDDQIDYCLRPHGMMRRLITLEEGWYKDSYGPILAFTKDEGVPVALFPDRFTGYYYTDVKTGKRVKINGKTAGLFDTDAVCFYRPLPPKKIGIPDLLVYLKRCISMTDFAYAVIATLAVTLTGMLLPRFTKILTGPVLTSGSVNALIGLAICLLCVMISNQLITSAKGLLFKRIETKTSVGVQASMMMRLMSLPASFFRKYSAGELKARSTSVNQLCSLLLGMVMTAGLSSVSSLLYIPQIFSFAPVLVVPAIVIILVTLVFTVGTTMLQTGVIRKQLELSAGESGMTYSVITGIQKIKLAGAEKRVFAKWLNLYAERSDLIYNPPLFVNLNVVIRTAIGLISNIVIYFLAVQGQVDPSSYFAFTAAYGTVMGAFNALSDTALYAAQIKPILEMAEPFLKTEPETADGKEIVTRLSGSVELDHIDFRYTDDTPYILKDLSLKIKPGEYVAIVGRTGCGKSTLIRLLLGFEDPEKGAVYYDGKDINSLDLDSLRRKVGVVMQDADLFHGDIYSNIVISAPELTLDDAWEAAEVAGIADEIRRLPMGMRTYISDGHGGVSGGQKQRLMIARAIAPRPKILVFDEATSALDNRTQRQVSEALDAMGCTRIVIAHRLSTIKNCDRILVLDEGRIVEDGTYEELIEKGGSFKELVERQRLETA